MDIKQTLDHALAQARERAEIRELAAAIHAGVVGASGYEKPINLLISGPTGVGKTAIITEWGEDHAGEIHFYMIDAPLLNVTPVGGREAIFGTNEIEAMAKPDTVLFIDNYHLLRKAVKPQIDRLMDTREVIDASRPSGVRKLDNILFVVAAVTKW